MELNELRGTDGAGLAASNLARQTSANGSGT
jgi:hypothetical protein